MRLRGSSSSSSPWTWLGVRREKGFVWRQNSARNNRTSNLTSISSPTFPYSLRQCSSSDSLNQRKRDLDVFQPCILCNIPFPPISANPPCPVCPVLWCQVTSNAERAPTPPHCPHLPSSLRSFLPLCCQLCFASGEHRQRMADRVYILN